MVPANCFIYKSFQSAELEQRAKSTRANFLGFVRYTFEQLLAQGRSLWEFKSELLVHLGQQEGKAAFEAWLNSEEFGSSRYIAYSAMHLNAWYNTLPAKVQRLVTANCHRWSVAALCELSKLTDSLVKELVASRKKHTARSVRDAAAAAGMSPEEWEAIAQRYGLSESELCNLREQARIFATAETPEDATTAVIRRGHVTQALEYLGFKPGRKPGSAANPSQSSSESNRRDRKVAISTYNLSEEDERKLTKLAETRGVTPNKLISQLLATAPELQPTEEEAAPETAASAIEQAYREQIAALQEQLAAVTQQMRALQEKLAASDAAPAPEKAAEPEPAAAAEPTAPAELVEATAEEIEAIAPAAARSVDVRQALATAGESTLFLVQRLLKSLKKATAQRASQPSWEEDFAIDENQEVENWEPA